MFVLTTECRLGVLHSATWSDSDGAVPSRSGMLVDEISTCLSPATASSTHILVLLGCCSIRCLRKKLVPSRSCWDNNCSMVQALTSVLAQWQTHPNSYLHISRKQWLRASSKRQIFWLIMSTEFLTRTRSTSHFRSHLYLHRPPVPLTTTPSKMSSRSFNNIHALSGSGSFTINLTGK